MANYQSTKIFDGFSTVFRQWRAETTHCRFLHGYGISFKLWFEGELDERNWVVDFGGLKPLKAWLEDSFDHKLVLDREDPMLYKFTELENAGLAEITLLDGVGVEKFAEHAYNFANTLVQDMTDGRCKCVEVECAEHGANSAIYKSEK